MIHIIVCSVIISALLSFLMIKFQMRIIEKRMDRFFEEEQDYITRQLRKWYRKKEESQ